MSMGMKFEPSASDIQAQNRGAEHSGGVVKIKTRTMRAGANLPEELWLHIVGVAVYLHNHTLRRGNK